MTDLSGPQTQPVPPQATTDLAELHSRAHLAQLDLIYKNAPLAIGLLDTDLRYIRVNDTLAALNGVSAQEHIGRTITQVIPGFAPVIEPLLREVLRTGAPIVDHEIRGPDLGRPGQDGVWRVNYHAVRDETGQIIGLGAILQDVTDATHLRERLSQAQKMESIGRLAGGVAHDFNNFLCAIQSLAATARAAISDDHRAVPPLDQLLRVTDQMTDLTTQLLTFAREGRTCPRSVNLGELVRSCLPLLGPLLGSRTKTVLDLDPTLLPVRIDPAQFTQVIVNLAINARDAMPDGGILTISTRNIPGDELPEPVAARAAAPAPHVLLAVRDTGIGMDEQTREHIFEPFFTTKPDGRGTGLGLPTCYSIVDEAGGTILVNSAPGEGSTFGVYLPAEAAAPAVHRHPVCYRSRDIGQHCIDAPR